MARKNKTVAERQASLRPIPTVPVMPLEMARGMYEGVGGEPHHCIIDGHYRTRIFDFPGIDLDSDGNEPPRTIYSSTSVQATVACRLEDYFVNSTFSGYYANSPSLRHRVNEVSESVESKGEVRAPIYLVVEECNQLAPVEMAQGECCIWDEVVVRDDKRVPALVGGREGEKFISAWHTVDGAWPELRDDQRLVNMILAGVRVGLQTADPIRKHLDQSSLVTTDGRIATIQTMEISMGVTATPPMDPEAFSERVNQIGRGIANLERDMAEPHMALLFQSMYRDDHLDDSRQRLHYLQLWQSLSEVGRKYLGYEGNIRQDEFVIAGEKTLKELKDYRDGIAHGWTDHINGRYLADLQRTINRLLHDRHF